MGPPDMVFHFEIRYEDGTIKPVTVYNWNRGSAWAAICRDLNKSDHGDTNQVNSVRYIRWEKASRDA